MLAKNTNLSFRAEGDRYMIYDKINRNIFLLSPELFHFWNDFSSIEECYNSKKISPETLQNIIQIFKYNNLFVERKG